MSSHLAARFANVPLITLDRIRSEPRTIFSKQNMPGWVRSISLICTSPDVEGPDDPNGRPDDAYIRMGRTRPLHVTLNLVALGALAEMTRYGGIWVHTNSNGGKPVPRTYARMAFPNLKGRLIDVRRILYDAPTGLATKAIWRENDYSPEHTGTEPDGHATRYARLEALDQVAAAARENAADAAAFLGNLDELFKELDLIRDGKA